VRSVFAQRVIVIVSLIFNEYVFSDFKRPDRVRLRRGYIFTLPIPKNLTNCEDGELSLISTDHMCTYMSNK